MLAKPDPTHKWPTPLLGAAQLRQFLGISEKTLERRLKDGEWNAGERLRLEMLERLVAEATRGNGRGVSKVTASLLCGCPKNGGHPPGLGGWVTA